ncbi:MAG TPA: hypothetical protein VGQ52_18350 [Gemmatimonadaceae bacterium]|jgi:hypothetical protein|nr:hypothetical protein [Gemmatimonadaceae bacterium]
MQRRERERSSQRGEVYSWRPVSLRGDDGEGRRRSVARGGANLAEAASRFIVAGAFRATVEFDVRDLRVGSCRGDFIENDGSTIDAAVDQQHQ